MSTPALAEETISLTDRAYERIESLLVRLELAPGSLIQERNLIERVGIGRTPVREAVQRLAAQGLIEIIPRKGMLVTPLRRSALQQIIEARKVMERLLVVKAAERASTAQRNELGILAKNIAAASENPEQFLALDRSLDQVLSAASGNEYLVHALSPLQTHCRRVWFLQKNHFDLPQACALHSGLAGAVESSDGSGAIRALNGIIAVLEKQVGGLDVIS